MEEDMCLECLGEGKVITQSKALSSKLVVRKCTTCEGTGVVPNEIVNSVFLNSQVLVDLTE